MRHRKLYKPDEISAPTPTKIPVEALNMGPARFEPGPPREWEKEHRFLEHQTINGSKTTRSGQRPRIDAVRNRPVPRLADHHYHFPLASAASTVYFY